MNIRSGNKGRRLDFRLNVLDDITYDGKNLDEFINQLNQQVEEAKYQLCIRHKCNPNTLEISLGKDYIECYNKNDIPKIYLSIRGIVGE